MTIRALTPDTVLSPDSILTPDGVVCDFLNVPTASGATTPHQAGLVAGSGTLDLRIELMPYSWANGSFQALISQDPNGSGARYWWGITAAGGLEYDFFSAAGFYSVLCVAPGFAAGSQHWLRVLHNIGAGTVDFYSSADGVSWTPIQAQTTGLSTSPMATTGTAPVVRIGTDVYAEPMVGGIFHTLVLVGGSTILNMDWTTAAAGTGPWVATSGETWTRVGTAFVERCAAVFAITAAATQAQAAAQSRSVGHNPAATQAQVAAASLVKNSGPAGLPQIVKAAAAINPTDVLGCGDARAEVWTRGGTARVIDLPNITGVEYNRVRSDTSLGSVTLDGMAIAADPGCCAVLNTIRPWKHELHIYRDDKRVWLGPINEILLDGPVLSIKARDKSAWLDRRFIHFPHQYGGQQANQGSEESTTIFLAIATDGIVVEHGFLPSSVQLFSSVGANGAAPLDLMQRTYSPAQFKPVGPEMRDMAKGALDWTVINSVGYLNYATWRAVSPNPVVNPGFEVNTTGWTGMTRDTGVVHTGTASGRTGAPPNATGSMVGLTVGKNYQMRFWMRGTSSALDAAQVSNDDGVVKVGNDESSVFSWYVYGQPTTPTNDNRGRANWIQVGVFFTATATTMPITITATGAPIDSHGIYFDDFEVWEQIPSFTLRDYSLAEPAKVSLSGLDQVTRAVVANQQSGGDYAFYKEAPKPNWVLGSTTPPGVGFTGDQLEFGLLEAIYTQALSDSAGAQNSATQKAASLGGTPILLDKIVLSPNAGVTMQQLIPGVLFTLRLDEPCFAVQAELVLQSVTVKTTPTAGETVELGFEPTGF